MLCTLKNFVAMDTSSYIRPNNNNNNNNNNNWLSCGVFLVKSRAPSGTNHKAKLAISLSRCLEETRTITVPTLSSL